MRLAEAQKIPNCPEAQEVRLAEAQEIPNRAYSLPKNMSRRKQRYCWRNNRRRQTGAASRRFDSRRRAALLALFAHRFALRSAAKGTSENAQLSRTASRFTWQLQAHRTSIKCAAAHAVCAQAYATFCDQGFGQRAAIRAAAPPHRSSASRRDSETRRPCGAMVSLTPPSSAPLLARKKSG